MKIHKLLLLLLLAAAVLCLFPAIALASYTTPLIAGGGNGVGTQVGTVEVSDDGTYLYVKYLISDPTPTIPWDNWMLTETHVAVTSGALAGIPQKKGNPIPGKFEFNRQHGLFTNSYTYQIPRSNWPAGTPLLVAAHGVVKRLGGAGALAQWLPDAVNLSVIGSSPGGGSYNVVTIWDDTFLNGMHPGWCVDTTRQIDGGVSYRALVFSSYESLPAGLLEQPGNLDLVNWIINQGFVGTTSPSGGAYTYGDMQRAIWTLLSTWQPADPEAGTNPYTQAHVAELVAAAQGHDGFEPAYNQCMLILLAPVDRNGGFCAQVLGIPFKIVWKAGGETAWAKGMGFPGANWAMYFRYEITSEVIN